MKPLFRFLARLLAVSLLLYSGHRYIMLGYEALVLLAYLPFAPGAANSAAYYDSSYRIIPFLALILATPGLAWKRRIRALVLGVGVFWSMDFISTLIWGAPPSKTMLQPTASQAHVTYSLIWELLGHWLLPLVLWIILSHRYILEILPTKDVN